MSEGLGVGLIYKLGMSLTKRRLDIYFTNAWWSACSITWLRFRNCGVFRTSSIRVIISSSIVIDIFCFIYLHIP